MTVKAARHLVVGVLDGGGATVAAAAGAVAEVPGGGLPDVAVAIPAGLTPALLAVPAHVGGLEVVTVVDEPHVRESVMPSQ
eukprot:CAMPEP_0175911550 /NCGR_PEP_ID=MMETSP0108-20121206/8252_1 /TAXON_ID=195067 ORGANISM="Goniomonas pacifica, Strain CCMP1869" /NCGR_SAMPLE_ID=MMETSP0108 /ASSEMBLY_ACC=CAM_ASM_000204 /LENGTH=80 /DNA_ID=CAMNT_0017233801 /DNA_START=40 /DNA_END=279 /DNA_ORIENTATION=-